MEEGADILEESFATIIGEQSSVIFQQQSDSHDETSILCYNSTQSHTLDLHAKAINQRERSQDVHHVLHDADEHGESRVLHTNKPTHQTEKCQRSRSTPDHDVKVGGSKGRNILRRSNQGESSPFHRNLKHYQQECDAKGDDDRAHQNPCDFSQISAPQSLGGHTTRAHP